MTSSRNHPFSKAWRGSTQKEIGKFLKIIVLSIKWLFRYSGLEFFYKKFNPPKNAQTAPTGFIWLIGIYLVFFAVASQRYENRIDIIEIRANSIFAQLAIPAAEKKALSRIPSVQSMPCPSKPNLLNPVSVFISLFRDGYYEGVIALLKEAIEDWKDSLNSVNLSEAILRRADLRQANFQETDLSKADLQDAILREADFQNANLSGANLLRADLRQANFQDAFLQEANFPNANLKGANLQRADLWKADLRNTDFQGANLRGANLQKADLRGASLQRASLLGADLQKAFLQGVDFRYTNLWGANLKGANLQDANLRRAGFQNTDLRDALLQGADLRDAFLQGANLQDADLQNADLQEANLRGASLQDADLRGAKALTVEQLCKASILYETKLGQGFEAQIKQECADLLKEPQTTKENTSGEKSDTSAG